MCGMKRFVLVAGLLAPSLGSMMAQVSFDRILTANKEPQNWLTYSGNLSGQRYSELTQIRPDNVKSLEMQWAFQARSTEKFETTPIVVDGKMYLTQAPNDIVALDAETGRTFWIYNYTPSTDARPCCGRVNRGVAILGDTLFMATLDSHLIAVDATNGHPIWNVEVASAKAGYAMTLAPLVIKDKVIVGVAGGEYGIRGYISAYDAKTGKEAWRFYTIPGPGEPGHETWAGDSWKHGGAPVWLTGSYDSSTNLTYWGIGNPGPDYNGKVRAGDNLYSDCVVALDADTGKLKWYFQFTPHDLFDYDSAETPVLIDAAYKGKARKLLVQANRNGYVYVLDRTDGKFLSALPFVEKLNWAKGIDAQGRPIRTEIKPTPEGTRVCPGYAGATNWFAPSYNEATHSLYFMALEECETYFSKPQPQHFKEGEMYYSTGVKHIPGED